MRCGGSVFIAVIVGVLQWGLVVSWCAIHNNNHDLRRRSTRCTAAFPLRLSANQLEEEEVRAVGDLYSPAPKARLTTANVRRPLAEAKELKITVGPDTHAASSSAASKPCYFEADRECRFTTKGGICPVDGRPCGSNRAYLDHVYSHKTRVGKDPFAHVRTAPPPGYDFVHRNAANKAQSPPSDPLMHPHTYYRHADSDQHDGKGTDGAAADGTDRPTVERRHQALFEYLSTDPQGEFLREVGSPPTTYPARFLYDIVCTARLGLYILRLVVNVIVTAVDDTARRSISFVMKKDAERPLDE